MNGEFLPADNIPDSFNGVMSTDPEKVIAGFGQMYGGPMDGHDVMFFDIYIKENPRFRWSMTAEVAEKLIQILLEYRRFRDVQRAIEQRALENED
jgi:hypothetical protein